MTIFTYPGFAPKRSILCSKNHYLPPRSLLLIVLAVLTLWFANLFARPSAWAARLLQSPVPTPSTPCASQSAGGYTFDFLGYLNNSGGTTTLYFRVTTTNKKDISHIAFGTMNWTPIAPTNNLTVTNSLGTYLTVWTNTHGEPGFPSFKFQPQFSGFSQGKQDTFSFTVANFNPNTPIQIQVKAGTARTTVNIPLDNSSCNLNQPLSPLPTPTPPAIVVYVLTDNLLSTPLSATDKAARWQQGLPVPLATVDTSIQSPTQPRQSTQASASNNGKLTFVAYRQPQFTRLNAPLASGVVDHWLERDRESVEPASPNTSAFPNTTGDCVWSFTQKAGVKQKYIWGAGADRSVSPSHALWPAGAINVNAPPGTQPLPAHSPYPADMITGVICKLAVPANTYNVLAEFHLWFELADAGDSLSVQFYSGNNSGTPIYRGGLEWRGSANGKVTSDWSQYRIYYPGLAKNNDTVWVQWQFTSDANNNPAQGPWLDNLAVSSYQKPQNAVNCATTDPTYAPTLSKGLNVGPYTEDLKTDDPTKLAQFITRMATNRVNWVRMEFKVDPSNFTNPAIKPLDPTVSLGANQIDLRHYDRFIDSLCALNQDNDPTNDIAILGLVDYTTLVRQDWQRDDGKGVVVPNFYLGEFIEVVGQLTDYYNDRIGAWEVWNEPDYSKSGLDVPQYSALLNATYTTIKQHQPNSKVLFTGLVGANRTAITYFRDTFKQGLDNPRPFDIFALHPYFTEEYVNSENKPELDPAYYMRGDITARPATIIKKFRENLDNPVLFGQNELGKPHWVTEVGWNSAKGTMPCPNYQNLVVDEAQQACYLQRGFHSLFNLTPTVSKVFWFNYHDTSYPVSTAECGTTSGAPPLSHVPSPSWAQSDSGQYLLRASGVSDVVIPWGYGLYHGNIQLDIPEEQKVKPAQRAFQRWPQTDTACMEPWPQLPTLDDFKNKVYLPTINGVAVSQ